MDHEDHSSSNISVNSKHSKEEMYSIVLQETSGLLQDEKDAIANTANVSSLLFHSLNARTPGCCNWCGFYFLRKHELVLGPFQGKPACIRIKVGKGVCGTAVKDRKTQVVPDVHKFPGHIACDSDSQSEIVVPLIVKDEVVGVLDLDSPNLATYDAADHRELEKIAKLIEDGCDWSFLGRNVE